MMDLPEPEIVSPFSGSFTGTTSLISSWTDVPVSPWATMVLIPTKTVKTNY